MRREVRHLRVSSSSVSPAEAPSTLLPPATSPKKEKFPVIFDAQSVASPKVIDHPLPPMRPLSYGAIGKILRRSEATPFDPTDAVIIRRITPSLFFYCTQHVGYLVPVEGMEAILNHFPAYQRHVGLVMSLLDGCEAIIDGKNTNATDGTMLSKVLPFGKDYYEVFRTHYGMTHITQAYSVAVLAGFHPDPQRKTPPLEECLFYNERLLEPVFGPDNALDILAETHFYIIHIPDRPVKAMYPVHRGEALCVFANHTQTWITRPETPLRWHLG